jgi:uncharacterized cupin superfamily protein
MSISITLNNVTHQQIWMLEGEMNITVGDDIWELRTGDCLSMTLGQQIVFLNQTSEPARYLIALTAVPSGASKNV